MANVTTQDLILLIGAKEVELAALRVQLERANAEVEKLKAHECSAKS